MKKLSPTDRAIPVNISLPSDLLKIIDDYAMRCDCSRSIIIRAALNDAYSIRVDDSNQLAMISNDVLTCIYEDEVKRNGNK